jgi:hypothetical protein
MILRASRRADRRHPPSEGEILALLGGPALWDAPGRVQTQALVPLARSLSNFLAAHASADRPLLIVLDDYDLADEGTRGVVCALVEDRAGRENRDAGAKGPGGIAHAGGLPCPGILIVTAGRCRPSTSTGSASSLPGGQGSRATCTGEARIVRADMPAPPLPKVMAALAARGVGRPMRAVHPGRGLARSSEGESLPMQDLALGGLSGELSRRLVQSVPGARLLGPAEVEALVREAEGMPGRLVRLAHAMAGRQRILFPPLSEPRATSR